MDPRMGMRVGPTREAAQRLEDEERRRREAQALMAARMGLPMWDAQTSQLPAMVTTAEAPDALAVRLTRMTRPELQEFPAVTRDTPTFREMAADVAAQPFVAAGSMVSRFGEGALRKLEGLPRVGEYLGRGADAIKANHEALLEAGAPTTDEGRIARGVSEIGVSALPYVAAGGGPLGLIRSAGLTGIESETDQGSFVKGMADLTGSDALKQLADSKYRTAADVGTDVVFNLIPGARGAYRAVTGGLEEATEGLTGLERMRVGAQQLGANTRSYAGTVGREALQAVQQNPGTTSAALLSLAGLPGSAAAPFFMGSVMPVGKGSSAKNLPQLMGQTVLPVEGLPGSLWNVETAEGIAETFPRTRAMFSAEQLQTVKPTLEEIDKHFQLAGDQKNAQPDLNVGLGSYAGQANVNVLAVLPQGVGSTLEKDAAALGLAISQRQNAVPWMTPVPVGAKPVMDLSRLPANQAAEAAAAQGLPETGIVVIPIPKAMNAGQANTIAETLQNAGLSHNFTQVGSPTGNYLIFGNFSRWSDAPVSDAQMLREIAGALNGNPVWEKVAPGEVQPFFARVFGNYLGDSNEASHLEQLRAIAAQTDDPAAASLARRLTDFLDRNTDRLRSTQTAIDRAYQPASVFDQGVAAELRGLGQTMAPGLEAPYDARGLHPSLLERGDPTVPLLDAAGKPVRGAVPSTTSGVNIDRSLNAIDQAFAAIPNPMLDPETYKRWGSMLFGPVIPRRPAMAAELAQSVEELRPLLARLDNQSAAGPARPRAQMGMESDEGLKLGALFDQTYKQGTANPVTSLMLYSWGALSKRASVAPHETAFLDLVFAKNGEALAPILERVSRGVFTEADRSRIRAIAAQLPEGAFSRQVTSNINDLANGLEKMAQPAVGGRMVMDPSGRTRPETNAERWHTILGDRSMSDEQFLREFQRTFADTAVGIDNKVASFIGLVTGRRNLIVPDRVQLALQWRAGKDFANTSLSSNIYEKGGLSGLFKGAQGVAMQEAIQRALTPSLDKLYRALGRPGQGDLGRLHWESWVASSDQEVGHGSLDVIREQAAGRDISKASTLVKEGQLDRFRYGEIQGVLNGERVFGFMTSDGTQYVMPRDSYLKLQAEFKKMAPRKFEISKNTTQPYFLAEEYPTEARDLMIRSVGIEVPPPSAEAVARGQMEQARTADQQQALSDMARRPAKAGAKTKQTAAVPMRSLRDLMVS